MKLRRRIDQTSEDEQLAAYDGPRRNDEFHSVGDCRRLAATAVATAVFVSAQLHGGPLVDSCVSTVVRSGRLAKLKFERFRVTTTEICL